MYQSPSHLPEAARATIVKELNACLASGLDLHSQIKVAHWNIKGPGFAALHPLFEQFAVQLALHTDAIAERAVTLGGLAYGTTRHVASKSALEEYPQTTVKDQDHVRLLAERFDVFLRQLREVRTQVAAQNDEDSEGLLTTVIGDFEKNAWFLRASMG